MAGNMKVLLVEDDRNLGYILSEYLQMKGFAVTWAPNGKAALEALKSSLFDICLLDIMLPDTDGLVIAEQINDNNIAVPFIFLTAKGLKVDKLKGFRLGCDDYITKPVDEEELVARIKAVVKRNNAGAAPPANQFRFGNSSFNFATRQLQINGIESRLTEKEAEVLRLLVNEPNTLLSRDMMLKKIWHYNDYFNRRSMDVIISRLRKRLAGDKDVSIINVHGKGYVFKER
jgi:two-component system OmpR family response regulator